jgi:hypothetical protein
MVKQFNDLLRSGYSVVYILRYSIFDVLALNLTGHSALNMHILLNMIIL